MAYAYITRSLFKADRLMFAMHLAHGMFPKKVPDPVSRSLIHGDVIGRLSSLAGMGAFHWLIYCRRQRSSIVAIVGQ